MRPGFSFRDLIAWQQAMKLCMTIYALTACFPPEERFGLSGQMRRAAVSIASNIAEGHARPTRGFVQFLMIARGSHAELETQLEIARGLGFGDLRKLESAERLSVEVGKLLTGLTKSIQSRVSQS
jgi:four helix bundle protein